MAKVSTAEQLDILIREAAGAADSDESAENIAARIYESERELIEPFIRDWVIEKLTRWLGKYRTAARREKQVQTNLVFQYEEALGFKYHPARLKLSDGSSVQRAKATAQYWDQRIHDLKAKDTPALEESQRIRDLYRKHAPGNRWVTYEEILEMEAARLAKKKAPK